MLPSEAGPTLQRKRKIGSNFASLGSPRKTRKGEQVLLSLSCHGASPLGGDPWGDAKRPPFTGGPRSRAKRGLYGPPGSWQPGAVPRSGVTSEKPGFGWAFSMERDPRTEGRASRSTRPTGCVTFSLSAQRRSDLFILPSSPRRRAHVFVRTWAGTKSSTGTSTLRIASWQTSTPGSACERSTTSCPPIRSSILRSYSIIL